MVDGSAQSVFLPLSAAVDLAHALVHDAAQAAGVRNLFLKGPVANFHGVREHRISSDVDVLVAPHDIDALIDELRRRGWTIRPESFAHRSFVTHSVTLLHREWPCDIDVHRSFPGFTMEDDAVFEILWSRRQSIVLASTPVLGADFVSSVIIAALHSLRATYIPRHAEEFEQALIAVRRRSDYQGIVSELEMVAEITGASGPLAPFLEALDIHVSSDRLQGQKYAEWQRNTRQLSRAGNWLTAMLEVPLLELPVLLWKAIFPGVDDLLIDHPSTPRTARGISRTWMLRLMEATRALPAAIQVVLAERRIRAGSDGRGGGCGRLETSSQNEGQAVEHVVTQQGQAPPRGRVSEASFSSGGGLAVAAGTRTREGSYRARANVAQVDLGATAFLLPLAGAGNGAPIRLSGTGCVIWSLLEDVRLRSLSSIVEETAGLYAVEPSELEEDVRAFIESLVTAGVVDQA